MGKATKDFFKTILLNHQYILLTYFEGGFRMSCCLFLRIKSSLEEKDEYFVQKRNAAGVLGLSSLQKMSAVLRMLTVAADFTDEYVRIGESTTIESLKKFVEAMVDVYSTKYLRSLNSNDIARLLRVGESRGFPGMLGSIDCMHWKWKNFPSSFVKTIPSPQGRKNSLFATTQESKRKDVEHAFGVLQAQFAIVRGPARLWRTEALDYIMKACIILHNMITEDERDANGAKDLDYEQVPESIPTTVPHEPIEEFSQFTVFIAAHEKIRNRETHFELQLDLVEHLLQRYSEL
ncbi:hypothetical protein SO802_012286 [Lithocarpus litseifolius]|uniref:Nuclease HARBI1 n=1 Tax=Lithocarpus litseifolius TaxID=425828 RepID=A0AAW2D2C5_9ROSI